LYLSANTTGFFPAGAGLSRQPGQTGAPMKGMFSGKCREDAQEAQRGLYRFEPFVPFCGHFRSFETTSNDQ
jgi:hypothetical protein